MTRLIGTVPAVMAALMLMVPHGLLAHAQQEGSDPAHESTIGGSPEQIAVWFDHEMRLTFFEVSGPDGPVDLRERPGRTPVSRFETAPSNALAPGEYTVRWRGLAEDGHAMFDEFYFTVR
nr:copper resistance CopC family protein [Thioalkalivibrio sp.]